MSDGVCRITITGSGFSTDKYTGSNVVYIGALSCNVVGHMSGESIVSETDRQLGFAPSERY
jgi:hypothetical protein